MKQNYRALSLGLVVLIVVSFVAPCCTALEFPRRVSGYVYVDDMIAPAELPIKIDFPPYNDLAGDIFAETNASGTGYYITYVEGHVGETGVFYLYYSGQWRTPEDRPHNVTIIDITAEQYPYKANLSLSSEGLPYADANGPYTTTINTPVSLNGSASYDPNGSIIDYAWDVQDDGTYDVNGSQSITNYTYTTTGTYTVRLQVTDNEGNTATDTATVTVTSDNGGNGNGGNGGNGGTGDGDTTDNSPPVADASLSDQTGFINQPVTFDGSRSSDSDGTITTYNWQFGDGIPGSGITLTHTYVNPGTYAVTLTVTDNQGATDTGQHTVTISVPNTPPTQPRISGLKMGTQGISYTFQFLATDEDNDTLTYTIDWGDTITTSDSFPQNTTYTTRHTYTTAGLYSITATANDNQTQSTPQTHQIGIDIHFVHDRGYLLDLDADGIYDSFYSNDTKLHCNVTHDNDGYYVIDIDCDDRCDFRYDEKTDTILNCATETEDNMLLLYLLLLILLLLLLAYFILTTKKEKTPPPPKQAEQPLDEESSMAATTPATTQPLKKKPTPKKTAAKKAVNKKTPTKNASQKTQSPKKPTGKKTKGKTSPSKKTATKKSSSSAKKSKK